MSSIAQRRFVRLLGVIFLLGILFAICLLGWRIEKVSPLVNLRFVTGLLAVATSVSVALLLGVLMQRARLEAALREQAEALQRQTETAVTLARDVETARAEVQKFNAFLEKGHAQQRLSDLRISSTALRKEVVEREQTALSLQVSQSELVLARDEIERTLAEHTAELERSNHDLEQFAYVASHDLQEPLRAISGCIEIFKLRYSEQIDQRGHELIAHTVEGVARMRELIEDLLEYSRVRRGGAPEPVSAEIALKAALKQLESAVEKSGALIEYEGLPTVCADGTQLVQLLQNLIGNALKYRGSAPPHVKISTLRSELMWIFAIRDNGIGIEPQYFERIFSIFQRLHTRSEYPGTGIGLALCRRIVEQAGGLIWIDSELGKGSTFYFTLPAIA